jgi:hypothetical protein
MGGSVPGNIVVSVSEFCRILGLCVVSIIGLILVLQHPSPGRSVAQSNQGQLSESPTTQGNKDAKSDALAAHAKPSGDGAKNEGESKSTEPKKLTPSDWMWWLDSPISIYTLVLALVTIGLIVANFVTVATMRSAERRQLRAGRQKHRIRKGTAVTQRYDARGVRC